MFQQKTLTESNISARYAAQGNEVKAMFGFIEIQDEHGQSSLLNIDHITDITKQDDGSARIRLAGGKCYTVSGYDKITDMIDRRIKWVMEYFLV